MGVLTEAMMRLQGEIGAWRHERVVLQHDLARQANERHSRVSALRAAFVRDRAGAHRAWFGPTLSERRAEERQQPAKETRAEVQREHKQQRLAEETRAKVQRKQQSPAKAKLRPQGHNPLKPVAAPGAPPPVAPLARAHRLPLKGSKKH